MADLLLHQAVQDLIKARDTFGWGPEVDEKINALRPLSTQPQQAGWKMVPVEPNLAMLQAGRDLDLEAPGNGWLTNLPHYELRDIWQTMLNAAPLPHPPVHEGGGA